MKSLRRKVEKFCYDHPHFGVPRLMSLIVVVTAIVYIISSMDRSGAFLGFLMFDPKLLLRGQVWRLITWIFLPIQGGLLSTVIGLYFYYFIGSTLENAWGTAKFNLYYILGMLLNIIFSLVFYLITRISLSITATYLNLSMFFAFSVLYPDQIVLLFFIIPIKIKWLALVDAAFFVISIITDIVTGVWFLALMPIIAMLSFVLFCGEDLMHYMRRTRAANMHPNVINYKTEARKMKREVEKNEQKGFRHKCSVCGKTDADHPDLEFRYCSRCAGYHCFCMEHINNHVHFDK